MRTLIIDNYDSFTYNLYQYLGQLGGNPYVCRNDQFSQDEIARGKYSHLVISPGPGSPDDPNYFGKCKEVILKFGKKIPLLGVCLGHQGIMSSFGGKVVRARRIIHGKQSLIKHTGEGIFKGVKNPFLGMRYHSLIGQKESLPCCLKIEALTCDDEVIMAISHKNYLIFGVQFHPESIATEEGKKILKNFLSLGKGSRKNES